MDIALQARNEIRRSSVLSVLLNNTYYLAALLIKYLCRILPENYKRSDILKTRVDLRPHVLNDWAINASYKAPLQIILARPINVEK